MWKCLCHLLIGGRSRFIWHLNSTVSLSVTCFSSDLIIPPLHLTLEFHSLSKSDASVFHQPWLQPGQTTGSYSMCKKYHFHYSNIYTVGPWSQHLNKSLLSPKAGVDVIPVERMQVGSSRGRAGSGSQNSKSISPDLWKYFSKMAVFKLGKVPAPP